MLSNMPHSIQFLQPLQPVPHTPFFLTPSGFGMMIDCSCSLGWRVTLCDANAESTCYRAATACSAVPFLGRPAIKQLLSAVGLSVFPCTVVDALVYIHILQACVKYMWRPCPGPFLLLSPPPPNSPFRVLGLCRVLFALPRAAGAVCGVCMAISKHKASGTSGMYGQAGLGTMGLGSVVSNMCWRCDAAASREQTVARNCWHQFFLVCGGAVVWTIDNFMGIRLFA